MNDSAQTTVFKASGADVENAQKPNATVCVLGTRSWFSSADRSRERPETDIMS